MINNMKPVPVSIYDMTAGQTNEEFGYGYLRTPFIFDQNNYNALNKYCSNKLKEIKHSSLDD